MCDYEDVKFFILVTLSLMVMDIIMNVYILILFVFAMLSSSIFKQFNISSRKKMATVDDIFGKTRRTKKINLKRSHFKR